MIGFVAAAVLFAGASAPQPAEAGDGAAWAVGGLLVGKMVSDHQREKQDEAYRRGAQDQYYAQQQQYAQQQYAQQQAPQQQAPQASAEQRLQKLKELKDKGLISESDYNTQKAAIVSSL